MGKKSFNNLSLNFYFIGNRLHFYYVLIYNIHILPYVSFKSLFEANISPFYQVFISNKAYYKTNISEMQLWLSELQELDLETLKIKTKGLNGHKKLDGVLYY